MKNKLFKLSVPVTLFLINSATLVFAQQSNNSPGAQSNNTPPCDATFCLQNPFKVGDTLYDIIKAMVNDIVLPIGGVLAVLAFIYSGFLYVTAQGNETKIKKAHNALLYTAIGTVVLLGSWVIANVIRNTVTNITNTL